MLSFFDVLWKSWKFRAVKFWLDRMAELSPLIIVCDSFIVLVLAALFARTFFEPGEPSRFFPKPNL